MPCRSASARSPLWERCIASCNLASPTGLEPVCLCVRSAVLLQLSYGEMTSRLAPIAGIEPASSPVNGRPRAPCSPDGNEWWRNRESNPGRRSCKDQLQPAAFPVPGRGFEPRSPRLRRGAFTRSAYQAHWRGCRSSNPGLMSGGHLLDLQATPARSHLVGSGRNRTSCPEGTAFTARRRHQPVLTCTSRSFSFGCRDRSRTDLEQLMRLPGSRTSLQKNEKFPSRAAGRSAVTKCP